MDPCSRRWGKGLNIRRQAVSRRRMSADASRSLESRMEQLLIFWQYFLLVLIRMTGLFTLSPIYGRNNVPQMVKVGLSVLMTFVVVGLFPDQGPAQAGGLFSLVILCLSELLVGLTLGFMTTLFFSVVFTAGQMIDMQIGFGMVQVYDVQTNVPVPIAGSLLNLVLLQCFLTVDGHTRLIAVLMRTFEAMPVGQANFRPELALVVTESFCQTFLLSVNVAMPVLASGLLAEVALGIIVRSAPQMNVFVIGIPLKTLLGLLMLSLFIPVFVQFTGPLFDRMFAAVDTVFRGMAPV